jgi:uncharacterized protein DUF4406
MSRDRSHCHFYLAGPMSGLPDFNYPAFSKTAAALRARGFTVINPAENPRQGGSWAEYMRDSLVMVSGADAVALLPGWEASKGARLEVHCARELGMPVVWADTLLPVEASK